MESHKEQSGNQIATTEDKLRIRAGCERLKMKGGFEDRGLSYPGQIDAPLDS